MFSLFNLGTQELLILFCAAAIAGMAILVVFLTKRQGRHASLEAENERLRDELARHKKSQG